jgi:ADP-ribose pyrophosphatase
MITALLSSLLVLPLKLTLFWGICQWMAVGRPGAQATGRPQGIGLAAGSPGRPAPTLPPSPLFPYYSLAMPVPLPPNAKQVFHGVIHDIWQCDQELYDGTHTTFEYMVRQDSVTVIGFADPQTIILTRQEQPGRGEVFLDAPGGRVDEGETHEQAALREFQEETGLVIGKMFCFRNMKHMGTSRYAQSLFIATNLTNHEKGPHMESGEKIEVLHMPWKEAVQLSAERKIRQPEVMLAIMTLEYHEASKEMLKKFLAHDG